jgi:type V secretory pathway adhesin AidA
VINATTTSASGNLVTLDALVGADVRPEGSEWTFSPGLFYHHQIDYIGTGLDFAVKRDLFGGDTRLGFSYVLRYDFLELRWWDGTHRGSSNRMANNFLFSWDQHLSTSVKTGLAAQYTRQDGFLSDQYNFVAIYSPAGVPTLYDDERLPDSRNRGQLNARVRWSPRLHTSAGLDLSYYFDDWGIETVSGTVSFETVLSRLRLRAWYRLAVQDETKYFVRMPTAPSALQTQDSDLASFTLHAPGLTLFCPLGRWKEKDSELRFTVWGFSRDDGVDGLGAKIGVQLSW